MSDKLHITRKRLANGFIHHTYKFKDFTWQVEVKRAPVAFFDRLLAQHFRGTYYEFARFVMSEGEPDDDLHGSYLYGPVEYSGKIPSFWRASKLTAVVALDPPTVDGDDLFVELVVSVGGEDYLVSASSDAPIGLLAQLDYIARRVRRARS